MSGTQFERPDGLHVTFRRMRFDFEDGFDRFWHGGSAFRSLFWSQLSTAFQPGERFFIDSARALKGRVDDPRLLEELMEFCRQEGHHTAQHLKFDQINEDMGLDIATCRRRYARLLGLARRVMSPIRMLGITCALEHFTSGLADLVLSRSDMSKGADARVMALWYWHAIEEGEHRATCFDVYRSAKGSYWTRVTTLFTAWTFILSLSMINTFMLLRQHGRLFTGDTVRGLVYLFGPRGVLTALVPVFGRYLQPGFQPWDEPLATSPATIAAWQKNNQSYIVNLDQIDGPYVEAGAA